jgi:hypothetical protein
VHWNLWALKDTQFNNTWYSAEFRPITHGANLSKYRPLSTWRHYVTRQSYPRKTRQHRAEDRNLRRHEAQERTRGGTCETRRNRRVAGWH